MEHYWDLPSGESARKGCGKWLLAFLMSMLLIGQACAGKIAFSGAVVVPTCSVSALSTSADSSSVWQACGRITTAATKGDTHADVAVYRTKIRLLDKAESKHLKSVAWLQRHALHPEGFALKVETRIYQ